MKSSQLKANITLPAATVQGAGPPDRSGVLVRRAATRAALVGFVAMFFAVLPSGSNAAFEPNRVVALTPFSANAMAEMGAFPAAVGQTLGGDRRLAPGLSRTPVLKLSHPMGPNPEELAVYAPRLIFTSPQWAQGRSMMKSTSRRVVNADPKTVQDVYAKTRQIGSLVGREARAARLVKSMKRKVVKARKGAQRKVRVMVLLGVGRTPFVFLDNSWGGQIVKLAGGRLLTGGARSPGGFAKIGDDVVVSEKPDVIIAVPHAEEENIPDTIKYLKRNPAWASTPAVKNGRVYISTDNSLLQAGTDIGRTIGVVRKQYLKNG